MTCPGHRLWTSEASFNRLPNKPTLQTDRKEGNKAYTCSKGWTIWNPAYCYHKLNHRDYRPESMSCFRGKHVWWSLYFIVKKLLPLQDQVLPCYRNVSRCFSCCYSRRWHDAAQYFRAVREFGYLFSMHRYTMTSPLRHLINTCCSKANAAHFSWLDLTVITLLHWISARVHIRLKETSMQHTSTSSTDQETVCLKPRPVSRTQFTPCHLNSGNTVG